MEGFERVQERDKLKEKYCLDNKVDLLVIPFYNKENIPNILKDYV